MSFKGSLEYPGSPWFFDKYYSNKTELKDNDEILQGRYVLVKYSDQFYTDDEIANFMKSPQTADQRNWVENFKNDNQGQTDGKSYDRMVFVKRYVNGAYAYEEVCKLGSTPSAEFTINYEGSELNLEIEEWN